jgi:hypothetical protein
VIYSLVVEQLTASVGSFLSAVCPEPPGRGRRDKKKSKSAEKASSKRKRKAPAAGSVASGPDVGEGAGKANSGPQASSEKADTTPAVQGVSAIWEAREPQRQGAKEGHWTPRT